MYRYIFFLPFSLFVNVYIPAVGWSVLYMSVRFIWSIVSCSSTVSLLILYLDELSIVESGVLKSPTIIVLLSISPLMSVNICFIYVSAPTLGAYVNECYYVLIFMYHYIMSFFIFCYRLRFKVNFV